MLLADPSPRDVKAEDSSGAVVGRFNGWSDDGRSQQLDFVELDGVPHTLVFEHPGIAALEPGTVSADDAGELVGKTMVSPFGPAFGGSVKVTQSSVDGSGLEVSLTATEAVIPAEYVVTPGDSGGESTLTAGTRSFTTEASELVPGPQASDGTYQPELHLFFSNIPQDLLNGPLSLSVGWVAWRSSPLVVRNVEKGCKVVRSRIPPLPSDMPSIILPPG